MKEYLALGLLVLTATACGGGEPTAPTPTAPTPTAPAPPAPSSSSGYAGQWSGTVLTLPEIPGFPPPALRPQPLSFTIAADQRLTDLSIGYMFNGCLGVKTFSGSIPIGPSRLQILGEQGWSYSSRAPDGRDRVEVHSAFTSDRTAGGTSAFIDLPGCGTGGGNWTATKQ